MLVRGGKHGRVLGVISIWARELHSSSWPQTTPWSQSCRLTYIKLHLQAELNKGACHHHSTTLKGLPHLPGQQQECVAVILWLVAVLAVKIVNCAHVGVWNVIRFQSTKLKDRNGYICFLIIWWLRGNLFSIGTDNFMKVHSLGKHPVISITTEAHQINLHMMWTLFIVVGKDKVLLNNKLTV